MEERVKSKRHFDKEFKQEAVRLVEEGHRRISDVARDLGIEANMLHRWKRELETGGAPLECASMKVAAAIFSKGQKDSLGESFVSADIRGTEKLMIFRHIPENILFDIRTNNCYNLLIRWE